MGLGFLQVKPCHCGIQDAGHCPYLTDSWCFCSPLSAAPSLSTFPFFPHLKSQPSCLASSCAATQSSSHRQGAGTSCLLAGLGGNSHGVEECLTWGLLPAWDRDILVFWLCEGGRNPGRKNPGQCGALCRAGADLLEGQKDPKILPCTGEPFLGKAGG